MLVTSITYVLRTVHEAIQREYQQFTVEDCCRLLSAEYLYRDFDTLTTGISTLLVFFICALESSKCLDLRSSTELSESARCFGGSSTIVCCASHSMHVSHSKRRPSRLIVQRVNRTHVQARRWNRTFTTNFFLYFVFSGS